MKQRVEEIDFLKCIFILLMIVFHLRYIGDTYPYVKSLVYTFHMPAFLIISGYLMNVQKTGFSVSPCDEMDFCSLCIDGNRLCADVGCSSSARPCS